MKRISTALLSVCVSLCTTTAQPTQLVLDYIDTYRDIAISEMIQYKIPASITMAQGILESGAGQSELAKESNNHFGIKCHDDWKGDKVYYDDDEKGECFRKYDHVEDSYDDHSLFLVNKPRYSFLFELDIDDYKGWAKGLKEAGYATNPKYADLLIGLIEDYQLYELDRMTMADVKHEDKHHKKTEKADEKKENVKEEDKRDHKKNDAFTWGGYNADVYYFNRIPTVTIKSGDTPESLAQTHHTSAKRLYEYNDLKEGDALQNGSHFYLQPKRKKGTTKYHVVQRDETLWSISRDEGVELVRIYYYNLLSPGQEPATGEKIYLRKKRNEPPLLAKKPVTSEATEKKSEPVTTPVIIDKTEEEIIEFEGEEPKGENQLEQQTPQDSVQQQPAASQPSSIRQPVYHTVAAKETLYSLSKQYNVSVQQIQQWNSLPDTNIRIGMQLIVGYR